MNAGKTTSLLQFDYNCITRNINTIIFIANPKAKTRIIKSRIGIKKIALPINSITNIYTYIKKYKHMITNILIDEAQFLTKKHIFELISIVDKLNINVFTYGLKTDFKLELFIGSKYLLILADKLMEINALCKCGAKAIANARITHSGKKITIGKQILLNKNAYTPVCRYHYFQFKNLK